MIEDKKTPKWAKLPSQGASCRICGQPVYTYEEHEVVKPQGGRPTMYFHSACVKKEQRKPRKGTGLHD